MRLLLLFTTALFTTALSLTAAEIRVDLAQPGRQVSPNLFGIFFEEINHAGDGGIVPELVRNGSFAEAQTIDAWAAVRTGSAKLNLFFDTSLPLSKAKERSLRVEVTAPGGEKTGVSNEGYWGMALASGKTYEFSAWMRASNGFTGPLTVSLEGAGGTIYAQQEIGSLTAGWKKVNASLTPNASDPKAHLTISTSRTGTFWLNMVSLRPAGELFRTDLLQKLRDLKPAFVRFPGGTYVQGNDRNSAFHWKETIGKLEDRPGHYDAPWVYWSTDTMGYHEYLLLCDHLHAIPMYVVYGGMTWTPGTKSAFGVLQNHKIPVSDIPLDQMGPVVQDALDAIEYANGTVTSTWGALRAKAGHPAPFGLKYVELGNEDGRNPLYAERYMLLYKAIRAKFPEIMIISNTATPLGGPVPMDYLDEHAYVRPLQAIDMARVYDTRDPKGPKVFLGEFAVQNTAGLGNMRAALGDAILLSSVERNSDRIELAAYAPLLGNLNALNWKPNLIYFDGAASYGTPSYYVQKMLADTRIDKVFPVTVTAPELKVPMSGDVSTQPFDAEVEVQDAKVTGTPEDYTYSLRARKTSGDGGLAVHFAVHDGGGSYLAWVLGVRRKGQLLYWGGGGYQDVPQYSLESSFGGPIGAPGPNATQKAGTLGKDQWYDVSIHVQGRRVVCSLDGKQIHDTTVPESLGSSVYAEAGRAANGNMVLRMVNASPVKQGVDIDLTGIADRQYRASATDLSSKELDAENTLAAPTQIAPVHRQQKSVGNRFHWEIEGNSFTVLTLEPEAK